MFDNLTEKLDSVFKKLRGQGRLTEDNIQQSLREVRLVLLEADVHFRVVKDFIAAVRNRAVGQEVLKSLNPAQQVIKVVRDELGRLMGEGLDNSLQLAARPAGRGQDHFLCQAGPRVAAAETQSPAGAGRYLPTGCH